MGFGYAPDLFWDSTLQEVRAVLRHRAQLTRAANLRAGLVAAVLVNLHRKKGAARVRAEDFLTPDVEEDRLEPAEAVSFMDRWMTQQNATQGGRRARS